MDVENNRNKAHKHNADTQSTVEQGAEILEEAEAAASDAYDKTSKAISSTYDMVMGYGSENPGKTILIALGVGAGVAFILGAGSRSLRSGRFAQPIVNALSDIAMGFFR